MYKRLLNQYRTNDQEKEIEDLKEFKNVEESDAEEQYYKFCRLCKQPV